MLTLLRNPGLPEMSLYLLFKLKKGYFAIELDLSFRRFTVVFDNFLFDYIRILAIDCAWPLASLIVHIFSQMLPVS